MLLKASLTVSLSLLHLRFSTREGNNGDYYGIIRADAGTVGLFIEHSFHINMRSTRWLMDNNNLMRLAEAEAALIAKYFDMPKSGNQPDQRTLYRVQSDAYSIKANAEKQLARLRAAGFDAFISS